MRGRVFGCARLLDEGLHVFEPQTFSDERGWFYESFSQTLFDLEIGSVPGWVQDNHSKSRQDVVRGMHYQVSPHSQGKLVRCVVGAIFDVAVDIRASSPTFGDWLGMELSAENRLQLWIPGGFAHGFMTLSDTAEVLYKATAIYAPEAERSIRWNDPSIGIEWPPFDNQPILSSKDSEAPLLESAEIFA